LRTYFHVDLESLAPIYLQAAAEHLARYDSEIGPHAFGAFSIVSSPVPVGFGMPGIAYLGKDVLRLPFIPATSLRHEVLHDWWGNGVVPDYAQGNWAEGLTTLLADYAHRAEQGPEQAKAMRLGWLRDFAAVPAEHDRGLSSFVARRHGADQAVGYNKTAFVLLMLRDRIGEPAFRAGLQAFWREHRLRSAGWQELQRAFERSSGAALGAFFSQWLQRPGAPSIEVTQARRFAQAGDHAVSVVLAQAGTPFRVRVPLRVHHERGHVDAVVDLNGSQARAQLPLPARALFVELDPDVRVFRRLHPEEIAPTLRQVLLDPETRVAIAASDENARAAALRVAHAALENEARLLDPEHVQTHAPLLIVGLHAEVGAFLARSQLPQPAVPGAGQEAAIAYAWRTPDGRRFAVVAAANAGQLAALSRPLPHLGGQSYAVFDGARSRARGLWPAQARRYAVTD
jgi:hypothetical protein